MSTPTAGTARPPMTRPRLSQLTLEGAAGLASTMLVAWLLLWFVTKVRTSTPVIALRDPTAVVDVPYLEADRIGAVGPKGRASTDDDADVAVGQRLGTAVVISIAGPGVEGPAATVGRIKKIASTAHRNVLILLDQSQVDVDTGLGVFGNAPYLGLGPALKEVTVADTDANVVVLCSAAPGQRSWMMDGLGRSAFSYFVQAALAGRAPAEGDPGRKPVASVDELAGFVRRNVQGWVKLYRRDAVQTPMLLTVGKSSGFSLPPIKIDPPGPASVAIDPKADPKAAVDPARASRKALAEKWEKHDEMANATPAPYRFAPAGWRRYEAELLRAERLIRAASHDPTLQAEAEQALVLVGTRQAEVAEAVKQAKQKEADFPIQPASSGGPGRRALVDSVKAVSGQVLDDPAARPGDGSADSSGRKTTGVAEEKPVEAPPELEDAARSGRPRKYLELQLPAWALTFQRTFPVPFPSFRDAGRSSLFKEVVSRRIDAEEAIAVDRRGLDWIRADVIKGDAARRAVQDALFGPLDDDSILPLKDQAAGFGLAYAQARESADRYHEARSLFEKVAAELPSLGEWAVLDADRQAVGSTSADPPRLPDRLEALLQATGNLGLALTRPGEAEALRKAFDEAEGARKAVVEEYERRYKGLGPNTRWRDIDDVLVTPWIEPKERQRLVEMVARAEVDGPAPSPSGSVEAADPAPSPSPWDPSFRRRSAGLAMLDYRLRSLALTAGETPKPLARAIEDLARARAPKDDPAEVEKMLGLFGEYTRQVAAIRQDTPTGSEPREKLTAVGLLQADREVRFRPVAEQAGDQPSADLEAFARYASAHFHADRLALDNARGLGSLRAYAAEIPLAKRLDAWSTTEAAALALEVKPDRLSYEKEAPHDDFQVGLKLVGARPEAKSEVPDRAFVAVVAPVGPGKEPPPLTIVPLNPATRLAVAGPPGGLVPVVGELAGTLAFRVEQTASVTSDDRAARLPVKAFYRGQVFEETRKAVVNVGLVDFGKPVTISIASNRAKLDARYGEENMKKVPEQFLDERFKGYLHARGRLDYVLTIQNTTPQPLADLEIKRTLKPSEGEGTPRKLLTIPVDRIGAREERKFADVIEHQDLPTPMDLVVEVYNKKKELLNEQTIRLEVQKSPFTQYLTVQANRELHRFEGGVRQEDCLVIRLSRTANDKTTEPILYQDIRFGIYNEALSNSLKPNEFLDRGGAVLGIFKILSSDVAIPYKVVVEGETFTGTFPVK